VEAVEVVGLLVLVLSAALLGLVARRRLLERAGGTVDMSLRLARNGQLPHGSLHWSFGVGRFDGDRLVWFKTFSPSPRPRLVIDRATLTVSGRRSPHGAEVVAVVVGADILQCLSGDTLMEIAVPAAAVPGLMAWLEAAPRRARV
jgi:hypothetical protein